MHSITRFVLVLALALCPGAASALDILLTNDDGPNPGISAMRAALCGAGHAVTTVRPAANQSGRGGSINTGVFDFASFMALKRESSDACGVVYSLAGPASEFGGTPVDSLKAGLNVVLAGSPPDLIVSGLNFGQNLSKPTSNTSGTVGAALSGASNGIPAIAGSVGILIAESGAGFPSTIAAFGPAAAFVVDVIAALEAEPGSALLPAKVKLLNLNFPVPVPFAGVAITKLADRSDLELPLFDVSGGFPPFFPPLGGPTCAGLADGSSCTLGVGLGLPPGPDEEQNADTDAHAAGLISITPMDGDMTAGTKGAAAIEDILGGLTP